MRVIPIFTIGFPPRSAGPSAAELIAIDSTREEILSGKTTTQTRYYVSSRRMTADQALQSVRAHWLVENELHGCLDVTFGQDANQTRTKYAAENLAVVRHFALNLVRRSRTVTAILSPARRRLSDYDVAYRETLLGLSSTT